jgi:hypothetical protein
MQPFTRIRRTDTDGTDTELSRDWWVGIDLFKLASSTDITIIGSLRQPLWSNIAVAAFVKETALVADCIHKQIKSAVFAVENCRLQPSIFSC